MGREFPGCCFSLVLILSFDLSTGKLWSKSNGQNLQESLSVCLDGGWEEPREPRVWGGALQLLSLFCVFFSPGSAPKPVTWSHCCGCCLEQRRPQREAVPLERRAEGACFPRSVWGVIPSVFFLCLSYRLVPKAGTVL